MIFTVMFLLIFGLGNGVKLAVAGNDVQSIMATWFNGQQSAAVDEVGRAIQNEKEILMAELRTAIEEEMSRSKEELDKFTSDEIVRRVGSLNEYANVLIENLKIDNSEEKKVISDKLDVIFAQTQSEINASVVSVQPSPTLKLEVPKVEDDSDVELPLEAEEDSDSDSEVESDEPIPKAKEPNSEATTASEESGNNTSPE